VLHIYIYIYIYIYDISNLRVKTSRSAKDLMMSHCNTQDGSVQFELDAPMLNKT